MALIEEEYSVLLERAYYDTLDSLGKMEDDTSKAELKLKILSELHRERIEESKVRLEAEENKRKAKDSKKDRFIKIIIDGLTIFVPAGLSAYFFSKGLKFEESGSFSIRTPDFVKKFVGLFSRH